MCSGADSEINFDINKFPIAGESNKMREYVSFICKTLA